MDDPSQRRTFSANPYDCLRQIAPAMCVEHDPIVSEPQWIGAGSELIKQIGAEEFLLYLLANLKGMNVTDAIKDESDLQSVITNPFYCLRQIASGLSEEHEPGMSEAQWVRAGMRMIQQKGSEEFLSRLLANLRAPGSPAVVEDPPQPAQALLSKEEIADAIVETTRTYTEAYFETSGQRELDRQLWAALHVGFVSALKLCGYDGATVDEALELAQEDEFFDS